MGAVTQRPYLVVGGVAVNPFNVLLPLSVTIGRSDPTTQPDANALSFGWYGEAFPYFIRRGAPVNVWMGAKAQPDIWDDIWDDIWTGQPPDQVGGNQRFIGRVADITATPDVTNGKVRAEVTCIGMLTDLADLIVGDEPWPIDTDHERVERIRYLTRNDFPFINEGSPALRHRKRDVDRRNALELLHLFAGSVGSIVWEYPDGSVHYQRWDTRDVPVPGVSAYMPPQTIIADAQWAQSTDQLIDRIRVEYGDDPPDGDRPSFVIGDGYHETRLSGEAADIGTATIIGTVVLDRWGRNDLWDAPTINTSTDVLDEGTYEALLALLPGDPLETGNLTPAPSPGSGGGGVWFVEGWQEDVGPSRGRGTALPRLHHQRLRRAPVRRQRSGHQSPHPVGEQQDVDDRAGHPTDPRDHHALHATAAERRGVPPRHRRDGAPATHPAPPLRSRDVVPAAGPPAPRPA